MSVAVISTGRAIRRKGSGARTWVVVGAGGEREEVEAGRQLIMRRTGLTAQDLRILDPLLSYSSTIVGRERAIVINLEHIKAIITAQQVLLLNSRDPSVIPFLDQLHDCILRHHQPTQLRVGNIVAYDSEEPQSETDDSPPNTMRFHGQGDGQEKAKRKQGDMKILPFEFVALEACLEAACTALENEAKILEQEAHTALDKLTSKVSTLNLERVRHIKSRLVAITGRVQKVKDELENLLDDDEDMSEMYLTNKLVQQPLETSSTSSMNDGDEKENQVPRPDINVRTPPEIFGASNGVGSNHETYAGTAYSAVTKKPDVEEVEMLLEAYFVQIGGTLNKLFTLNEYVDDTEDYINIMLDEKQNKLLQMEVRWETVGVLVKAFIAMTGIFAINIHNKLWDTKGRYLWIMGGCIASCIFLYLVANAWYKRKRLLD